jgi:hypothetical protein
MMRTKPLGLVLAVALLGLVVPMLASCGDGDDGGAEAVIDPGDGGRYEPDIVPANFVDRIDNPYLPYLPGSRWVYEGLEDGEEIRIEVEVTDQRREVMGISAVVVHEMEYEAGELIEDTFDWYAQDSEGNVWYLGEDTKEIEDGEVVGTEGAWEAGVDGALPGIIMLADPVVGEAYRQEYYEGEAEDLGEVSKLGETQTVAAGSYEDVLIIREWNPLEPDVIEDKYYAPGVGVVLELAVEGEEARVELIEYTPGG